MFVTSKRILIVCHGFVMTGGLLRFVRAGRVLRNWGHDVVFVNIEEGHDYVEEAGFPVISFNEAAAQQWDSVMVPGAGFYEEAFPKFSEFRKDNFGTRVQHILNDQTRRESFMKVNAAFDPQIVIFNNRDWPVGAYTKFRGDRFHVILGAVDSEYFRPPTYRSHPLHTGKWVIGGLANKNPLPLVCALEYLPPSVSLRLYGWDYLNLAQTHQSLITSGRLELLGMLRGNDLNHFYRGVDCVVMTERYAGWSNLAAEAMASGAPVVCTTHGTDAFAIHEETALLLPDEAHPKKIAEYILRLVEDASLCARLSEAAREKIAHYSWDHYARDLLQVLQLENRSHYFHAPELGLFGKWSVEEKLLGLQPLLQLARGKSVIDFGAAEGIVARAFLQNGAVKVHEFELDQQRVNTANTICADEGQALFRGADPSSWDEFFAKNSGMIDDGYDIVLNLGIQHHLSATRRHNTLEHAIKLARQYVAISTSKSVYEMDSIDDRLKKSGFDPMHVEPSDTHGDHLGILKIYQKRKAQPESID